MESQLERQQSRDAKLTEEKERKDVQRDQGILRKSGQFQQKVHIKEISLKFPQIIMIIILSISIFI